MSIMTFVSSLAQTSTAALVHAGTIVESPLMRPSRELVVVVTRDLSGGIHAERTELRKRYYRHVKQISARIAGTLHRPCGTGKVRCVPSRIGGPPNGPLGCSVSTSDTEQWERTATLLMGNYVLLGFTARREYTAKQREAGEEETHGSPFREKRGGKIVLRPDARKHSANPGEIP